MSVFLSWTCYLHNPTMDKQLICHLTNEATTVLWISDASLLSIILTNLSSKMSMNIKADAFTFNFTHSRISKQKMNKKVIVQVIVDTYLLHLFSYIHIV